MILEPFSAGYWLAPQISVTVYNGEKAIIRDDTFYELVAETMCASVMGSTGGAHFELHPERSVPDGVVAVPKVSQYAARDDDALLIAKRNGREVLQL